MNIITEHIEKIIETYTQDSYYEDMKKAIAFYIERTGKMNEESEEYESRMNSFNDWFIFNYRLGDGSRVIDQYMINNTLEDEVSKSLHNANYSLFLFQSSSLSLLISLCCFLNFLMLFFVFICLSSSLSLALSL